MLEKGINIGIVSAGIGHNTGIVNLGMLTLVYNDQQWHTFDISGHLLNNGRCDGIIYEIAPSHNGFIVIHEIGAKKFSLDGKCLWKIDSGLVENHRIDEDSLVLLSDGIATSFDKESGKKKG